MKILRNKTRQIIYKILRKHPSDNFLPRYLGYELHNDQIKDYNLEFPFIYNKNSTIGNLIFFQGRFENEEIAFINRRLSNIKHPIILDIGANIGWHSINWAHNLSNPIIYAFEPASSAFTLLRMNIELNHAEKQIIHINNAVSDRIGVDCFYECSDDAYGSLKDTKRKSIISSTQVEVTTIDNFVKTKKLTRLSLLKVDVEGLEYEVLCGANETLKLLSPEVFIEIYGGVASNPDPLKTINYMLDLGYKGYIFKDSKLIPFERHSDDSFNYYFTKSDQIN